MNTSHELKQIAKLRRVANGLAVAIGHKLGHWSEPALFVTDRNHGLNTCACCTQCGAACNVTPEADVQIWGSVFQRNCKGL